MQTIKITTQALRDLVAPHMWPRENADAYIGTQPGAIKMVSEFFGVSKATEANVDCDFEISAWLNVGILARALKFFNTDDTILEFNDARIKFSAGDFEIKINTTPDAAPPRERVDEILALDRSITGVPYVEQPAIDAIRAALNFCSVDSSNPALNAVLLDRGNVVATDGRRMAIFRRPGFDFEAVLPAPELSNVFRSLIRFVPLTLRVHDSGRIALMSAVTHFVTAHASFRTSNQKFPDWRTVQKTNPPIFSCNVDRKKFVDQLRAASFSAPNIMSVELNFDGSTIKITGGGCGAAVPMSIVDAPGEFSSDNKSIKILLNPKYAIDAAEALASEIKISISSDVSPVVFSNANGGDVCLTMPLRKCN